MKLKSKDDFVNYKNGILEKKKKSNSVKILVGLGTCGIAAGGQAVWKSLEDNIKKKKIVNLELVKVGCIGYCHAEPTIEILYNDGTSVLLGDVKPDDINDILELHLNNRCSSCSHVISTNIAPDIFKQEE